MAHSSLQFTLTTTTTAAEHHPHFGPRLGTLVLHRPKNGTQITLETPTLLTSTSRGVVPHLSRDHVRQTRAIGWVNVPFETFLEHSPPVPTLQPGPHALHRFLGFVPAQHLVSMSARDPGDVREMPPNGNNHVSVYSLRGVRKITPTEWRAYTESCQPDVIFALSDTPYTSPPFSQKRLTKSIDRSAAWLASLLTTPQSTTDVTPTTPPPPPPIPIFVHLPGSASHPARKAFAASLTDPLHPTERTTAARGGGLPTLDAGVAGYVLDLASLRVAVAATSASVATSVSATSSSADSLGSVSSVGVPTTTPLKTPTHPLPPLIQTSLSPLPNTKPRLVTGTQGPHEILRLIRDVGVDVVDAPWALEAAGCGVALDFGFPVWGREGSVGGRGKGGEGEGEGEKRELGRNLYEGRYALDFSGLLGGEGERCPCAACSPVVPTTRIVHGSHPSEAADADVDGDTDVDADAAGEQNREQNREQKGKKKKKGYTRAYIHHLLHTHEMGAHALLVMHNLVVVEGFLRGVRGVLASGAVRGDAGSGADGDDGAGVGIGVGAGVGAPHPAEEGRKVFEEEMRRFEEVYSEEGRVVREARGMWREVDLARGKGRLAREREKERQGAVPRGVEVEEGEAEVEVA